MSTRDQPGGGLAAALLLGVERLLRRSAKVEPGAVRNVLVLEYRLPLGCLVHMTPVFEAIKRSRPAVAISVATSGLGLQVLRHSPYVDCLVNAPNPTVGLRAAISGLRRQLRARGLQPDCILTGASDQRTRIALMGMLSAAGWRGGYTQTPRLYHRPLRYDTCRSLMANNLDIAKMLHCNSEFTHPRVFFSSADAKKASALLRTANSDGHPVAVFATQNSGGQSTGWHVDRFARAICHARERGFAVVYVGTVAEQNAIDAIRAAANGIGASVAGQTTVNELAALLAMSDLMVTLDTGTMHVGRAVRVPMVVLGPSWQKPIEWMPLDVENVRILRGEDRDSVPEGYRLDEISAEDVFAAFDELMDAYMPSAGAREMRVSEGLSEIDHLAGR